MLVTQKYWLAWENERNVQHGPVFIELIQRAFEVDEVVMVGHHFVFEPKAAMQHLDLTKLNEIPSADTLLFDHEIMTEVFGPDKAVAIMVALARLPAAKRDEYVRARLAELPPMRPANAPVMQPRAKAADPWTVNPELIH